MSFDFVAPFGADRLVRVLAVLRVCLVHRHVDCRPLQPKLEIRIGDVLRSDLPYFDVCVANMPYQVFFNLDQE